MPSPQWNGSPSRYQPNPVDDRAVTEADAEMSAAYLAVATAIESIAITDEGNGDVTRALFRKLDPGTRKALRTAESALRRAAFSIVLHADPERLRP